MTDDDYETFYHVLDQIVDEAGDCPSFIERDEKTAVCILPEDIYQVLLEKARAYDDIFADPITEREEEELLEAMERPARLH
ncbi:hypothetical protein [Pseudooceanicola sp. LIPI14-2-Ac024]|uniref:hypothetical protein n=1 Tax=Pseudooceanicola sp. LIPI14-2-Ac024 TaxID=3344875 RepID=UPI0035D0C9A2